VVVARRLNQTETVIDVPRVNDPLAGTSHNHYSRQVKSLTDFSDGRTSGLGHIVSVPVLLLPEVSSVVAAEEEVQTVCLPSNDHSPQDRSCSRRW